MDPENPLMALPLGIIPASLVYALATSILLALITAGVSLAVALWTQYANWRHTRLKSELDESAAIQKARRDYEFEARKRLYAECEPLLFQALELAEDARMRIASLARTSRNGDLRRDGTGWLDDRGYFYKSTAFMLLAPITSYKILQRQLTMIDLGLENRLRTQYELLKLIFLSFTSDFELARHEPKLDYLPDKADPGERGRNKLLRDEPEIYWRQGFYRGIVDMISEALITSAESTTATRSGSRCKSLGEFWSELEDDKSSIGGHSGEVAALIGGFHPQCRPVLWRVLVAQHRLYGAFLQTLHSEDGSPALLPLSQADFKELDWRHDGSGVTDDDAQTALLVADDHVRRLVERTLKVPGRTR
jgi:hypothetical protein